MFFAPWESSFNLFTNVLTLKKKRNDCWYTWACSILQLEFTWKGEKKWRPKLWKKKQMFASVGKNSEAFSCAVRFFQMIWKWFADKVWKNLIYFSKVKLLLQNYQMRVKKNLANFFYR